MLRTLAAQTHSALVPLLAAFYLAVGIHAVHPLVHRHLHHGLHCCSGHHLAAGHSCHHTAYKHEHETEHGEVSDLFADTGLHQHRCPLCDFLACCRLLPDPAKAFSFSAAPAEQTLPACPALSGFARPSSCLIRGPPLQFS